MDNTILEFLEAYKCLDELCKQILSSEQGISEYITEMSNDRQGDIMIACWEKDLKKLKKMRWKRNQLVHEPDSFGVDLVNVEDIEWLKNFRLRIMECTDPFSLLYQSRNVIGKNSQQETKAVKCYQMNKQSSNQSLMPRVIIFIIMIFIVTLIIFDIFYNNLFY